MQIAIAGAGMGGLTAAALLAQSGHAVQVFDQFDTPRPVGSGLVVQPVGQHVLACAGALAGALALGARLTRMLGHEAASNRAVLDVLYDRRGTGAFGLAIHRASLFAALLNAATRAGAQIVTSAQVTGTTLEGDTRWLTVNGTPRGPFDLVIDSSGAGSVLSPLRGRPLPYGAIWGTVPWPQNSALPYTELRQCYRRADRMVGVLPIGTLPGETTPLAAVFWSLPRDAHDHWRNTPLAQWQAEATTLWPDIAPFVSQFTRHDHLNMARYTHGSLRDPVLPRLAFIGDAAHRASPQLGQGANMALLDAYALTWALSQRACPAQALALYRTSRRWHMRLYQGLSAAFTPQYQSDSRVLPRLRDHILTPVSKLPGVRDMLTVLVGGHLVPPVAGEAYAKGKPVGLAPRVVGQERGCR